MCEPQVVPNMVSIVILISKRMVCKKILCLIKICICIITSQTNDFFLNVELFFTEFTIAFTIMSDVSSNWQSEFPKALLWCLEEYEKSHHCWGFPFEQSDDTVTILVLSLFQVSLLPKQQEPYQKT